MATANIYSLLELVWQYMSGWGLQVAMDTTFDVCSRDVNMLTMGAHELGGKYHQIGASFIPGNSESFVFYRNTLKALFAGAHVVLRDIDTCLLHDCSICRLLDTLRGKKRIQRFLQKKVAKAYMFDIDNLIGDEHRSTDKLADDLGVEKNKCSYHKTIIAKKGGKMRKYFSDKEAFEDFYEIISRAAHISYPHLAEPIQDLISDY
jgi:hypothetical protein